MTLSSLTRRLGGCALVGVLLLAGLPPGQARAGSTDVFCPGPDEALTVPPKDFPNRISGADRSATYAAAACALTYELMVGFDDNTFGGDRRMTRAQTATVIVRFVERARNQAVLLPFDYTNSFTDISLASPHRNSISQAHHLGLFQGVTETEFRPNDPVTREQFATIMVQAMRSIGKVFSPVLPAHNFTNIENSVHKVNIILATHYGWADALLAAPIDPVAPGRLLFPVPETTIFDRIGELNRFSLAQIMVIGGTSAVSENLWKGTVLAKPTPAPVEDCDWLCESMKMGQPPG